MPRRTAEESDARNKKKAAKKAGRQENRAKKIEARKGLAAGEGKKIQENRKARRKELFKDPEAGKGKFTEKYKGASVSTKKEGDQMRAEKSAIGSSAEMAKNDFMEKAFSKIKSSVGEQGPGYLESFNADRSDMSQNAMSAWRNKRS